MKTPTDELVEIIGSRSHDSSSSLGVRCKVWLWRPEPRQGRSGDGNRDSVQWWSNRFRPSMGRTTIVDDGLGEAVVFGGRSSTHVDMLLMKIVGTPFRCIFLSLLTCIAYRLFIVVYQTFFLLASFKKPRMY